MVGIERPLDQLSAFQELLPALLVGLALVFARVQRFKAEQELCRPFSRVLRQVIAPGTGCICEQTHYFNTALPRSLSFRLVIHGPKAETDAYSRIR